MVPRRPRRPHDPNRLGKLTVDLSTGAAKDEARLEDSPAMAFARQRGLKGGKASAEALTPDRRREIARLAADVGGEGKVTNPAEERKARIKQLANAISTERDCDVLIFNFSVDAGFDLHFLQFLKRRLKKRNNILLFLITEGGEADVAYRIGRYLQENYKSISIAVSGWCKSAGTLICIGANELIMFDAGELGPLDVQIAKADEVGEVSSGLAAVAAFEKLQQEAFKMFECHLRQIITEIPGRITLKTAADISVQLVVGVMRDIFAKIDPMSVGEDYRSNLIAAEYARRLNLFGRNLRDRQEPKGLEMLLNGYPSHRFAIDRREASNLFLNVSEPSDSMIKLADELGTNAILPRNPRRGQQLCLEYLNDEASQNARAKGTAAKRRGAKPPVQASGAGADDVLGIVPASPQQEPGRKSAA